MNAITLTKHKQFDLQTQLRLDYLRQSWAQYDQQGRYYNDAFNARCDRLWDAYERALEEAKAAALVPVIRAGLWAQFGQKETV